MDTNAPLLAFCVPTYNRSKYLDTFLREIITEIEAAALQNEVVVVVGDNDSSDDTPQLVLSYQQKSSVKIFYFRNQENIGAVNNIIRLVENSPAVFSIIFGDDDVVVANSLQKVVDIVKSHAEADVFHFKCKQTDFIPLGMPPAEMNGFEAAEKYFYNLGNAGTFFFRTDAARRVVAENKSRIASTCWPQTEIMFLILLKDKLRNNFIASGIELVSSDSHNENVIYNTWYIIETFCFSLLRVARHVADECNTPALMNAAKKSIPGCKEAVKFYFRFLLFATYYDYGYELKKTKELIIENRESLKGSNAVYPFVYGVLLALPAWIKKIMVAFYFIISNKSFKKSKLDKSYAEVRAYQQRKFEVYKQKGKLTEDTERYIY